MGKGEKWMARKKAWKMALSTGEQSNAKKGRPFFQFLFLSHSLSLSLSFTNAHSWFLFSHRLCLSLSKTQAQNLSDTYSTRSSGCSRHSSFFPSVHISYRQTSLTFVPLPTHLTETDKHFVSLSLSHTKKYTYYLHLYQHQTTFTFSVALLLKIPPPLSLIILIRLSRTFLRNSVTRLGYFWSDLETYSLTKLAQILGNFLFYLKHSLSM